MRYIDKSAKAAEGRALNIQFLKSIFDNSTLHFKIQLDRVAYNKYRKDLGNHWRPLLIHEQDNLCCYCMRELTNAEHSEFTAEHVIPRSLRGVDDRNEFQRYVSGKIYASCLGKNVEYSDDTENRTYTSVNDIDIIPKMPHIIAHENLLAACKGIRGSNDEGCCCNNERGREYLTPYMLIPGEYARFRYDINGIVSISPEDASWEKILKLLNGETLQEIRYIWRLIAFNTKFGKHHFKYDTPEMQRMNILKSAFKKNNFIDIIPKYKKYAGKIMSKGNDFTWKLLVDYRWFFDYYHALKIQQKAP